MTDPIDPPADAGHAVDAGRLGDAPDAITEARQTASAAAPSPSAAAPSATAVAPSGPSVLGSNVAAEPPAVVIDGATRRFGDDIAVQGISLTVPAGNILGIIGPSGAGKTTTIRMLTGALAPTEGEVRVLGEDPRHFRRATRKRIGYMPQLFALYPDLTARENVDFVASLFGVLWRTRHRRTREVLEFVDLWDVRSRRAGQLSGGMQRRLELACALVHSPDLMFLDEPTAGIDPLLRGRIWEELHRLRDEGRTLLVTTQYVNEAEECDAVALISDGRLIALAAPDDLRRLAMGGDTVELETAAAPDLGLLQSMSTIRGIDHLGARRLRLIVDDAATALPDIVDAIRSRGGEVTTAQEVRPSFDAVFAALVGRDREATAAASTDEAEPPTAAEAA